MPQLAKQIDKATLVRSVSYTPAGLFNHTAAIYQMMTGWSPDKVSPSGQLEPPSPRDFPHMACQISRLKPLSTPMLPFVEMPRPLQESNVIGKGGAAGFLGKAYDPYRLYQDPNKPLQLDDLALRSDMSQQRLEGRFELLRGINGSMKELEKAVSPTAVDEYYAKAYDLVLSGKARKAFDLDAEPAAVRERYGRTTFGQGALLARRLVEAGTRPARDHWPYCYTALVAGAGVKRGEVYGKSDATGSAPTENPVHPTDLLATAYYALGIDPAMEVLNDLKQPRPLVKGQPLVKLFG